MKTIASFTVNHDKLKKGMYVSRVDGDVVTYDIRMKNPNGGDYLTDGTMHTIEHLFATFARNSEFGDCVIYVGPMGCRTGFYLLLRDRVSGEQAIDLVRRSMAFIANFEGDPGKPPRGMRKLSRPRPRGCQGGRSRHGFGTARLERGEHDL